MPAANRVSSRVEAATRQLLLRARPVVIEGGFDRRRDPCPTHDRGLPARRCRKPSRPRRPTGLQWCGPSSAHRPICPSRSASSFGRRLSRPATELLPSPERPRPGLPNPLARSAAVAPPCRGRRRDHDRPTTSTPVARPAHATAIPRRPRPPADVPPRVPRAEAGAPGPAPSLSGQDDDLKVKARQRRSCPTAR